MSCTKYIEEIFSENPEKFSPELKKHILECEDCRQAAESWEALREVKTFTKSEIPVSVDFNIQHNAEVYIKHHGLTPGRIFIRWLGATATAACIALIAWNLIFMKSSDAQNLGSKNQTGTVAWQSLDMSNDFYEFDAQIEFNRTFLTNTMDAPQTESNDGEYKVDIPDLIT